MKSETECHPSTTLQKIINAGMTPGIAINPGTSIETIMEMLVIVKKVLVMSVNRMNEQPAYQKHDELDINLIFFAHWQLNKTRKAVIITVK